MITWQNAVEYGTTAPTFSFQLTLDSSGVIQFAYDGRVQIATAGDYLVGMSEGAAAAVPAASDYSVVGSSTTPTSFQLFNNVGLTFDLVGQTVQFVPTGLGYTWIPTACAGSHSSYGSGCYGAFASFYESFASNAIDLSGSGMTMLNTGTGYTMVPALTTYVAPSATATALTLGDDSETGVTLSAPFPYAGGTTTSLTVCSNGYISVATGNGTAWTPAVATMLAAPRTGWWSWHDFNVTIAGSGQVKFEEIAGVAYITWDGVYSHTTTNPETMQAQFDLATGNVTWHWVTLGGFGNAYLFGYSPGGASANPGNTDISATLPSTFSVGPSDQNPLKLSASPVPVPGATVTYTTDNIPEFVPTSGLYVALNIISIGQIPAPGVDLGLILGAPGCSALVATLDVTQAMVGIAPSQTVSFTYPVTVPLGLQLFSQSAALFTPNTLPNGQNAGGIITSNAIAATVGAW